METSTAQTFMWVISALTAVSFFLGAAWVVRMSNQRAIGVTKKHPEGMMIMEIWATDGQRRQYLVDKVPGGSEVRPPKGLETSLRYFYSKSAVGRVKYPSWMPFDFLRVDAPIASWWENHSVAMDPEGDKVTAVIKAEKDIAKGTEYPVTINMVKVSQAISADMQRLLQAKDAISSTEEMLRDGDDKIAAFTSVLNSLRALKYLPLIAGAGAIAAGVGAAYGIQILKLLGG